VRLPELVTQLRKPREYDPREYVSTWREKDLLDGRVVDARVIIFRTSGCYWAVKSGCSMCGYVNDTAVAVSPGDLEVQVQRFLAAYGKEPLVKVYTSGNFFDERELPPESRRLILKELGDRTEKVIVESLAHLVRPELVREGVEAVGKFEVALGLESANERVHRHAVNKPWGIADHLKAGQVIHESGGTVKTYIVVKPPFLTEREGIEDAVATARAADEVSDTTSFNPMNVQSHTLVDHLWRRHQYRAPWLWSVVEVLRRTEGLKAQRKAHPTAGGLRRGAHNCGQCDRRVIQAIEDYSLNLRGDFAGLDCACREDWENRLELEGLMRTSADLDVLLAR